MGRRNELWISECVYKRLKNFNMTFKGSNIKRIAEKWTAYINSSAYNLDSKISRLSYKLTNRSVKDLHKLKYGSLFQLKVSA